MTLRTLKPFFSICLMIGLALPAWAGGPLAAPDDVGNPSGADYTGYAIYGYVLGVRDDPGVVRTEFHCFNMGGADATDVAVQFYDDTTDASRAPVADLRGGSVPIGEYQWMLSSSATGAIVDALGLARILVSDNVRKRNPSLACRAIVKDDTTGATITELEITKPPKQKKRRRRR